MLTRKAIAYSGLITLAACLFVGSSNQVSAAPFEDITDAFSDSIGVSPYVGTMILSFAGIMAVSIVLAIARLPVMGIFIVLLAAIGTFTAIGWLDFWVLFLAAIVVAVYIASAMKSGTVTG